LSKNVALFIDVANLYYAARGQDVDVDYVALLKHATKGRDLIRAYAYSGLDPENENQRKFLDFLSKNGYKVVSKDIRKFGDGRVKANLDIELVVDLFRLATRMDIAVIVSGDGDFASAIRALQDVGVRCEVISFRPNTSSDLIAVADEFTDIMKILGIGRKKSDIGVPMPEMPAKEVNPEFGFREASRGVAAAALAALREGEVAPRARRTRGGRAGAKPKGESAAGAEEPVAASEEPVEPMTALEAHAQVAVQNGDSEARRRRRRRGGRGRGRGRRDEATAEAVESGEAEPVGDIGWQEFDDLSQLGDIGELGGRAPGGADELAGFGEAADLTDLGEPGEEREYAFSEADPATLAELGLTTQPAGDAGATPPSPPRRTRGRGAASGRRQQQGVEPEPVPEEVAVPAEKAPRRRRRGSSTSAAAPAMAVQESGSGASGRGGKTIRRTGGSQRGSRTATKANDAGTSTDPHEGASVDARPARRSRSSRAGTAKAAANSRSAAEGDEAQPSDEGIWQRFRSGRRTSRRTEQPD
jgi:uncharacterized LabA/DUF88 family protein